MNAARALLLEAARRGLRLYVGGDGAVRYDAERPVPADLLERLRAHRAEIRAELEREAAEAGGLAWAGRTAAPWLLRVAPAPPIDAEPDLDIAAALVDRLNFRFLAGEHDLADGAARVLEAQLVELARRGVKAWIATPEPECVGAA